MKTGEKGKLDTLVGAIFTTHRGEFMIPKKVRDIVVALSGDDETTTNQIQQSISRLVRDNKICKSQIGNAYTLKLTNPLSLRNYEI